METWPILKGTKHCGECEKKDGDKSGTNVLMNGWAHLKEGGPGPVESP